MTIDGLVDWQLAQKPPLVQVCRACLAAWKTPDVTLTCPHCGVEQ